MLKSTCGTVPEYTDAARNRTAQNRNRKGDFTESRMAEKIWNAPRPDEIASVFGSYDANINLIQKQFQVVIVNRNTGIKISGSEENIEKAEQALDILLQNVRRGAGLNDQTARYVVSMVAEDAAEEVRKLSADAVSLTVTGKAVRPRTVGQKHYLDAIASNTIVLGIGPAGTGKTYLALSALTAIATAR